MQGLPTNVINLTAGSGCQKVVTGGYADVSGDNENWSWNMTTFTKPVTKYFWTGGEPNNFKGNIEDIIVAVVDKELAWQDGTRNFGITSLLRCYICEYSP